MEKVYTLKMDKVGISDVGEVGGKNASLGEMLQFLVPQGVNIPSGFVVTASAYRYFLEETGLKELIKTTLTGLNSKNIPQLQKKCKIIREAIKKAEFPADMQKQIEDAYREMEKKYGKNVDVAVRSSATAEDLPGASFAGEHETFLNIRGAKDVAVAVRAAMASLFTDRATSYRVDKGFDHFKVALSVGVQKMVRSDIGSSGVMFTLDTESGFKDAVVVNAVWGLGEMIVQGEVTPDEFLVFKPTLKKMMAAGKDGDMNPIIHKKLALKDAKMIYDTGAKAVQQTKVIKTTPKERDSFVIGDKEVLQLAKWGVLIEDHYTKVHGKWTPMDMEWARDGKTGELFIVQARPETIHADRDFSKVKEYVLEEAATPIVTGISVGSRIATGKVHMIMSVKNIIQFKPGEVLVTDMTDPDWEPIMKIASAIVTDKGGRTSHAAIVSRELGIPCIVGSLDATKKLKTGKMVTVDTAGTEGYVYDGAKKFSVREHDVKKIPKTTTKITMNIATPDTAFEKSFLPNDGVGLAREEFIIASSIGIHPNALLNYKKLQVQGKKDKVAKKIVDAIDVKTVGYPDKVEFYVDKLAYGIAKIGAAFYPKQVIVRFSDFKTNEYRTLIGGDLYEPKEENPMIGWRGASRYYHPDFSDAFILELRAIKKVRESMGLDNVHVMIPFCRTTEEGKKNLAIMEKNGLGKKTGIKTYVMCEIPANIILADQFLDIFDGMSIGSNDLTQLTVGIDRDGNEKIKYITNEKDEAVTTIIKQVIAKCISRGKYIGICGQAPSDYPDFAQFLVEAGIQAISLNPDTVVKTTIAIAEKEAKLGKSPK